ncbi:hypothetical protein Glove_232g204 [Diversispora epigaea]|uniref:Uncharacterized protein n=1 Tax=Diversispora epigaea TaxID=1348612 RepID=A0A397IBM9_9GLOM|nr:hypothetical protein Glove_232g204 [Diversispora epigaea]
MPAKLMTICYIHDFTDHIASDFTIKEIIEPIDYVNDEKWNSKLAQKNFKSHTNLPSSERLQQGA